MLLYIVNYKTALHSTLLPRSDQLAGLYVKCTLIAIRCDYGFVAYGYQIYFFCCHSVYRIVSNEIALAQPQIVGRE